MIDSAEEFVSEPPPPVHAEPTDPLATLDYHASTPTSCESGSWQSGLYERPCTMNIALYSCKAYERPFFAAANAQTVHALTHLDASLSLATVPLARDFSGVCIFVNDDASAPVLEALAEQGTKFFYCVQRASIMLMSRQRIVWASPLRASPRIRPTPWPSTRSH
ncbi:MAG: hypothetical protein U0640_11620 [Phycisphaerales bacterium]